MQIRFAALCLAAAPSLAVASGPDPLVATFSEYNEGYYGHNDPNTGGHANFFSGGVRIFGVTNQTGGTFNYWAVDDDFGSIPQQFPLLSQFAQRQMLTINGIGVGGSFGVGGIGGLSASIDQPASAGSVSFLCTIWENVGLRLEAWKNGQKVASTRDYAMIEFNVDWNYGGFGGGKLEITGVEFDTLKLVSIDNDPFTSIKIIVDNVSLTPVPAPGAALGFLGLATAATRRRR